jgi:hypothetical protein
MGLKPTVDKISGHIFKASESAGIFHR